MRYCHSGSQERGRRGIAQNKGFNSLQTKETQEHMEWHLLKHNNRQEPWGWTDYK